ncbi:hypothetical protein ABZ341_13890 [Streptomyces sp. NPDC006173]|uniref:hypothetical protein n=1 Tax=Streptomyces sp. NPDC006173 TaxID=3155349 RepID=UPI0033D46965
MNALLRWSWSAGAVLRQAGPRPVRTTARGAESVGARQVVTDRGRRVCGSSGPSVMGCRIAGAEMGDTLEPQIRAR